MATHIVIPDTQVKPGVNTDHLEWAGKYIADQFGMQPDVTVIHLGDHWDMPSLSSYDKGTKGMEGRRYVEDIEAGNEALARLTDPIRSVRLEYEKSKRLSRKTTAEFRPWEPRLVLLRGNHEDRISRAINADARMDGALSLDQLQSPGWETHDYLNVVWIDGVAYSHYFYNPMSGRPYAGMIESRLRRIGHSFTMGHQQTLGYGVEYTLKGPRHGLVAGAFYQHDEGYKGPQGNDHWRGIVVCHEVRDGDYCPMFVSLDYLRRRYA